MGLVTLLCAFYCCILTSRNNEFPVFPSLCFPVGVVIGVSGGIAAGLRALFTGQIRWRGTAYDISVLRKGRRFSYYC